MSPDDPRHGSIAGYRAHQRAKQRTCDLCRAAMTEHRRKQPRKPEKPRIRPNYALAGYDPRDTLEGGRWMWDDRRAIRVWVWTDGEAVA